MNNATIVLATSNKGKIAELATSLREFGLDVLGLDAFPEIGDIEETGTTFEENALIKALAVAKATGLVAVADDSGLEVDALGRRPGVYSARYSDDTPGLPGETRDERNNAKLLRELDGVAAPERTARFRCVMAACAPDGRHVFAEGAWEGSIATSARGDNGFGYDPLFIDPESGLHSAELSRDQKNARSHRGKALRQLLAIWPSFWGK